MGSQQDLTAFELGWLIGILEGEGYFGYERGTCRVIVGMTDEDSMNRVAGLLERQLKTRIDMREESIRSNRPDTKPMYRISITGPRARSIMRLVVRHMSFRRRQCIWQCLNGHIPTKKFQKLDLVALGLIEEQKCLPN